MLNFWTYCQECARDAIIQIMTECIWTCIFVLDFSKQKLKQSTGMHLCTGCGESISFLNTTCFTIYLWNLQDMVGQTSIQMVIFWIWQIIFQIMPQNKKHRSITVMELSRYSIDQSPPAKLFTKSSRLAKKTKQTESDSQSARMVTQQVITNSEKNNLRKVFSE